jgi:hypothetical protein
MAFYPEPLSVPTSTQTNEFILRPLTPAHVQLDFKAVMCSKEMLRLWSGSTWPNDDFTLTDNLKDLQWHDREHRQRIAFTFTLLNKSEDACLGCLYINSLQSLVAENPNMATAVNPHDALVRFWVIETRLADGLDRRLLKTLSAWFANSWAFNRVCYHTRQVNIQQTKLFTERLYRIRSVQMAQRGGKHVLYSLAHNF